MKSRIIPTLLLAAIGLVVAARADLSPGAVRTVVITVNDNMKFSLTRIDARPGEKICVQLKNEGTLPKEIMGHNWVLLKAGKDVTAYAAAAVSAKDQDYQPKALAAEVITSIPLIGSRHSGETTFTVPSEPGSYPFLCSFPAHCQVGMRGELVVK